MTKPVYLCRDNIRFATPVKYANANNGRNVWRFQLTGPQTSVSFSRTFIAFTTTNAFKSDILAKAYFCLQYFDTWTQFWWRRWSITTEPFVWSCSFFFSIYFSFKPSLMCWGIRNLEFPWQAWRPWTHNQEDRSKHLTIPSPRQPSIPLKSSLQQRQVCSQWHTTDPNVVMEIERDEWMPIGCHVNKYLPYPRDPPADDEDASLSRPR